ncbi:hypothetical protein Q6A51_20020 [Pseudomonas sp. KFB-139]|uniref:Uncharacterized protein n=1 Tax=Pseudomonas serbiensis TaxID=3064350 RepID=A0ABT9CYT2_9PSED|nr:MULTISPECIES: hypothetical protein [Pseudomonas]MDO7929075.1 hypothetical protein [Pseudomonas sp. KFB-138]
MGKEIMAAPEQATDYKLHRRLQKVSSSGFIQGSVVCSGFFADESAPTQQSPHFRGAS